MHYNVYLRSLPKDSICSSRPSFDILYPRVHLVQYNIDADLKKTLGRSLRLLLWCETNAVFYTPCVWQSLLYTSVRISSQSGTYCVVEGELSVMKHQL